MNIPTDREVFEGEIATYLFADGILVSLSKNSRRTVENIKSYVALVKQITNNRPVPLLSYLSNSPVQTSRSKEWLRKYVV